MFRYSAELYIQYNMHSRLYTVHYIKINKTQVSTPYFFH